MFYYTDQPHNLSFPIGWVKTESDFARSVENGLGRWTLAVAMISADAYFLAFLDLTCNLEDTGIGIFCLHSAA